MKNLFYKGGMMKKYISFILILNILFAFSCDDSGDDDDDSGSTIEWEEDG
jgi:hypothetical protein